MTESAPVGTPDVSQHDAMWFGGRGASRVRHAAPARHAVDPRRDLLQRTRFRRSARESRAFRLLADAMTKRGFWSLRFDYYGEGDSAGSTWEPHRVDAWMESIDAAVGVLRARGVTDVRLVGFRMGASLAHMYAASHPGISSTVLWSPMCQSAVRARDASALASSGSPGRRSGLAAWFPDGAMEVAGFELSGEALRELTEIDLVEMPIAVYPRRFS